MTRPGLRGCAAAQERVKRDLSFCMPTMIFSAVLPGPGDHAQLYGDVVHVDDDPQFGDFAVAVFVDVDAVEFELFAGGGDAGWVDGALVGGGCFHQ